MKSDEFSRNLSQGIGLFGGTFNPIHQGHLQVARDVLQSYHLDRIYFIPSASPPHKSKGELAAAHDRVEMVRMALAEHPRLKLCDVEIRRDGPSYSLDTIRQCKTSAAADAGMFFMVGVDAFLEIHTWHHFDELFKETAFIVMSRPGSGLWSAGMRLKLADYVKKHIDEGYRLSDTGDLLGHPRRPCIYLASVTPVDIASTQLRRMIQRGEPIVDWVPPPVAQYIQERGLYQ